MRDMKACDIFTVGKRIILDFPEFRYPVRFHPWIHAGENRRLGLRLPPGWCEVATLAPSLPVRS